MPITKEQARQIAGLNATTPADEPEPDSALARILTFDEIEASEDLEQRSVAVPAWGGSVVVRGLSRAEFLRLKQGATDKVTGQLIESRFEQALLKAALVQPKVDDQQVAKLYAKNVGNVGLVVKAILAELGVNQEAAAADRKSLPD